ncbi:PC4/YdbC family ssDNA-binding protein [Anaerotignum sp.]|uniref:YdbC family protein n=1 Tax=Anaerotignum sp. TaxID=2039241 RepID=UPI0033164C52
MAQIKSEVVQHLGVISQGEWTRELNLVSWNGRKELYDIRGWSDNYTKCSKGITLNKTELEALRDLLNSIEL